MNQTDPTRILPYGWKPGRPAPVNIMTSSGLVIRAGLAYHSNRIATTRRIF